LTEIAVVTNTPQHYGSALSPPIASTVDDNAPSFVTVEGTPVMSEEDTVDTPTHEYQTGDPNLTHSHPDQVIDQLAQSFVTVEENIVVVEGDKHIAEDTRIVDAGQSFVEIS